MCEIWQLATTLAQSIRFTTDTKNFTTKATLADWWTTVSANNVWRDYTHAFISIRLPHGSHYVCFSRQWVGRSVAVWDFQSDAHVPCVRGQYFWFTNCRGGSEWKRTIVSYSRLLQIVIGWIEFAVFTPDLSAHDIFVLPSSCLFLPPCRCLYEAIVPISKLKTRSVTAIHLHVLQAGNHITIFRVQPCVSTYKRWNFSPPSARQQTCGDGIIDDDEQCECKLKSESCRYCCQLYIRDYSRVVGILACSRVHAYYSKAIHVVCMRITAHFEPFIHSHYTKRHSAFTHINSWM